MRSPTVACSRMSREISVVVDTASIRIRWKSSSLRGELTRDRTRGTSNAVIAIWQATKFVSSVAGRRDEDVGAFGLGLFEVADVGAVALDDQDVVLAQQLLAAALGPARRA